jgi:hypothetical protein
MLMTCKNKNQMIHKIMAKKQTDTELTAAPSFTADVDI